MPRPIHANAKATQARIIKAARKLFAARGACDTTLREIARQADVTMATIHHYFGSKDGLYQACMDTVVAGQQRLNEQITQIILEATSVQDTLDRVVRRYYQHARRNSQDLRLLTRTVVSSGRLDRVVRDQCMLPNLAAGAALVAPLVGKPEQEIRLALLSLNYLVARFALNSPQELAQTIGGDLSGREAECAAEDYLVQVARALLGM